MKHLAGRILRTLALVAALLFTAWAILALHFAPLAAPPWNDVLASLLAFATLLALTRLNTARAALACIAGPALVLAWFLSLRPTNDRPWLPEYAIPTTATITGNTVHVRNIRNFDWHTETEATPAYYDADFDLDTVHSLDLILSYWSGDTIAHVFVSFGFQDGRHLAISVETRRATGQVYSALAGFFRNYEQFYVVADERDLIGTRTNVRRESVYLYRIVPARPEAPRSLLLSYLRRIDALAATPAFYNTLTDNCTTAVVTRANATGLDAPALRYSWKLLASGYTDSYAYDLGRLDQSLPFAELKRRSRIEPPPAITPDFSAVIRAGRP